MSIQKQKKQNCDNMMHIMKDEKCGATQHADFLRSRQS